MPEQEQERYYSQALGEIPAQHGMTVLISPQGMYLGIDKSASFIWTLITQQGMRLEQVNTLIAKEYQDGDYTSEIEKFVSQMESYQILSHSPRSLRLETISIPWRTFQILSLRPQLQAAIALKWISLIINRGQVLPLIQAIADMNAIGGRSTKTPLWNKAQDIAYLVSMLAGDNQYCLHQSLAIFLILRLKGYDVSFNLGAHTHPFEAHSWVSFHDEPLAWRAGLGGEDSLERLKSFEVIYRSAPDILKETLHV